MTRLLVAFTCVLAIALDAQPSPDEVRARALMKSASDHETAGRLHEASRDFAAARDAAQRAGNKSLVAEAYVGLGYLQYYRGEMNDALATLFRAYNLATEAGDRKVQRAALHDIAKCYADAKMGQHDRAIEYYRQLLAQSEADDDKEMVADTLFDLGSTEALKGDFVAALVWYRRALAAEEKLGRKGEAAYVKRSMGVTLGKLGRAREALPLLDESLRVFIERKEDDWAMHARQSRGIVYRKLGRYEEAIADLEVTRRWFANQKSIRFLEKSEEELALTYSDAGRWREAYEARTRHAALQNELAGKLREENTSRLRVEFDSEKKEMENRALMRDKAAVDRIRRLQTQVLVLSGAVSRHSSLWPSAPCAARGGCA